MDDRFHLRDHEAVPWRRQGAPFGLLLSGLGACTAITLHGVDEDQRAKLAGVAEKTPVTRVIRAGTEIRTTTGAA